MHICGHHEFCSARLHSFMIGFKARQAPPILQHSITTALIARATWSALLTHAAQQAFAATLVETPQALASHTNTEGNEPTFSQLLAEAPPPNPPSQPAPKGFGFMPSLKHIWRLASIKQSAGRAGLHAEKGAEEKKIYIFIFDEWKMFLRTSSFVLTRLT